VSDTNHISGKGACIDNDVHIGDNVKMRIGISVQYGLTNEEGVTHGPHCLFTNGLK
jgi:hypothetical protein